MSRLMVSCLLVGVLSGTVLANTYSGGTGEPNDPYQIATAEDLIALGNEPNDYNCCFVLTADIDLSGYVFDQAVIAPDMNQLFDTFQGTAFTGIFKGQDYVIHNLSIEGDSYIGLFGYVGEGALISKVRLECVDVNGTRDYVGGIVGYNNGGLVSSCCSVGDVNGHNSIGGLVGYNGGLVLSSYSCGDVSGGRYVGGFIGINGKQIISSYSTSTVSADNRVGGFVGDNDRGAIAACYSAGMVKIWGDIGNRSLIGGLVGVNNGTITSSFWDTEASGQIQSDGGVGLTTTQMQDPNTFQEAGWDLVYEIAHGACNFWISQGGNYPSLAVFLDDSPSELNGSGTLDDPYQLSDVNDLGLVWDCPWAHYLLVSNIDLDGIAWNLAVVPWFGGVFDGNDCVITNFSINGGSFLGLFGTCISDANIFRLGLESVNINGIGESIGGLVGYNSGMIESSYCTGSVSGGDDYVGGLVGYNRSGSIKSSYSTGLVTGSDSDSVGGLVGYNRSGSIALSYSAGSVSGSSDVGGFTGTNYAGSITSSYSTGSVSGNDYVGGLVGGNGDGSIALSYNTSSISGNTYVGGIVGISVGSITSCYNTGSVSGEEYIGGLVGYDFGSIESSYSTGAIDGNTHIGGLVGMSYDWIITASFWDKETSGHSSSIFGIGLFTDQMQDINTFLNAGWDFVDETDNGTEDLWWMPEGDYPRLWWEE